MPNLKLVKMKGGCHWAIKAVVGKEARYRGFYYRKDAMADIGTWVRMTDMVFNAREFGHNFHTLQEINSEEGQ